MIYALKLLLFVLVALSCAAFILRPAFANLFTPVQYKRVWTCLLVMTVAAFLSLRPEVYIVAVAVIGGVAARNLGAGDMGKVNAFLLFLLPLPPIVYTLGGVGDINYILKLEHTRVLSLVLFAPAAVRLLLRQRKRDEPSLRAVDLAVILIALWDILLIGRYASLTSLVRTLFESFSDILIPYYVITRTIRTPAQLREAASHLMLGCVFVASVACIESLSQRNLYGGLQWVYGVRWESTVDLMRGGFLRVEATTPQPIVLAFVLMFGIGLWTWLKGETPRNKWFYVVLGIFGLALVSTWSRGPWLGTVLLLGALALQRWLPPRVFGSAVILTVIAGIIVKAAGADSAVMTALASIFGSDQSELATITYRRDLLDASMAMIQQSPWVGVPNYQSALQAFKQGEGMIDLVNTYIVIMINSGVIGLVLFLFPYIYLISKMLAAQTRNRAVSKAVLGKFAPAFIALIIAMLFTIFTASTLDAMRYLMGLAISFPAIWLMQVRQGLVVAEPAAPQPEAGIRDALVPGYLDSPRMLRR